MRKPIITALLNPINLSMLALAVAAGLCAAWWLFPLGLVFWGIMVIRVARDPSYRISHEVDNRTPLAPRLQKLFDPLEKLQINFYNAMNFAEPAIKRAMKPIVNEVNQLTNQTYRFCIRISSLENYRLVSQTKDDLELDWVELSQKAANTKDPVLMREYKQSLASLEVRLGKRKKITAFLDRIEAQLTSMAITIEEVLAETLRLQSIGAEAIKKNRAKLMDQIRQEAIELTTFEGEGGMRDDAEVEANPPPVS